MAPKEDPQAETSRLFTESLAGNFMQAALRIESDAVKRSKSGGDFLGPPNSMGKIG